MFQVQVLKVPPDIQQMEQQIKDLLQVPYDNGSISIATEDIQIRRICEYGSESVRRRTDSDNGSGPTPPQMS